MVKIGETIRKVWYYFRLGSGTYASMIVSIVSFDIMSYELFVKNLRNVVPYFPNIYIYTVVVLPIYFGLSVASGLFHKKSRSLQTDMNIQATETPQLNEILKRLENIENKIGEKNE